MTFLALEQSQADGRPVELFLFKTALDAVGIGFTNSESEITFGSETYDPIAISRGEPSYNEEQGAGDLQILVGRDLAFARRFIIIAPSDRYVVSIFRRHITDETLETVLFWKGFISQVTFDGINATITCKPLIELLTRYGPRMTFQQPCNHVLYDSRCTVNEGTFKTLRVPDSISADGVTLTFSNINTQAPVTDAPSGFQGDYWVGGMMRTPDSVDHRLIVDQSGANTIRIQYPFFESPAGKTLDILAGCDHNIFTCQDKFNNLPQHGGHRFLPTRNIYVKGLSN